MATPNGGNWWITKLMAISKWRNNGDKKGIIFCCRYSFLLNNSLKSFFFLSFQILLRMAMYLTLSAIKSRLWNVEKNQIKYITFSSINLNERNHSNSSISEKLRSIFSNFMIDSCFFILNIYNCLLSLSWWNINKRSKIVKNLMRWRFLFNGITRFCKQQIFSGSLQRFLELMSCRIIKNFICILSHKEKLFIQSVENL